jgi:hypothetical protein
MNQLECRLTELLEWADACLGESATDYCKAAIERARQDGTLTLENFDLFAEEVRRAAIDVAYGGQLSLLANSGENRTSSE